MAFASVQGFIANFQGGGARPNLFKAELTFPGGVLNAPQAGNKFQFSCKSASLPSSTIGIAMAPFMGRQVKFAGDKVFDDWTVQVLNDVDFSVRDALVRWSALINGHTSNIASPGYQTPNTYMKDAYITQYDSEDHIIKRYRFTDIFPTNVGEIQLGWDQNDMLEEYSVTFAVNWWEEMTNPDNTL